MSDSAPQNRLAAVLVADVVGYSAMMSEDERGTLDALTGLVEAVVRPGVNRHGGRVVKLMGDGVLAEFPSVVDAVQCALDWQAATADGLIRYRIGVHLGEILAQGGDIFGDGVNIAARLEGLAEPGGICVSAAVQAEVRKKLDVDFADLGQQSVKNIPDPISVYGVRMPSNTPPAPPLPKKPSIAILPFDNMSGDAEQEYLADGITEDLITALSKVRWLFVIARNSTFTYKNRAVDIKNVGRELGVRYVMEGSVRKAGSRVRITAQLIDTTNGAHVWAERYDRQFEDMFDLQDEMTQTIIGAVEPEISAVERQRVASKPPDNLDAWESYQRGVWHMWTYRREDNLKALDYLAHASELDPGFSTAYAYRAYCYYQQCVMHWSRDFDASLASGMDAARKALAADERDAVAYFAIGRIYMMQGHHDDSIAALETAVQINPSFAQAWHGLNMVLALAGEHDRAFEAGEMCERLSPRDPILWATLVVQALNLILARRYEEGLVWAQRGARHPNATGYWPHAMLAASLAHLGRLDEARAEVGAMLEDIPTLTVSELASVYKTREPDGLSPYLDGLRMAGLPE